jgi:hypothetical protein
MVDFVKVIQGGSALYDLFKSRIGAREILKAANRNHNPTPGAYDDPLPEDLFGPMFSKEEAARIEKQIESDPYAFERGADTTNTTSITEAPVKPENVLPPPKNLAEESQAKLDALLEKLNPTPTPYEAAIKKQQNQRSIADMINEVELD